MKRFLYITLVVIFSATFLLSAVSLGSYYWDARQQQGDYNDLASQVEQNRPAPDRPGPTAPAESRDPSAPTGGEPEILPEYAALYAENPDLVGWLKIDDTKINYPVMQTPEDKEFYLRRNFDKEKNRHGCLFVDAACDVFAPSDNLTIYGHKMRDGTMFADLHKFADPEFWEGHKVFLFDTLYQRTTYEVLAVFRTSVSKGKGFSYHTFVDAETPAEFDDFVSTCKSLALYDTGVTARYGDKLICLSTCDYYTENGRLVVVARRLTN